MPALDCSPPGDTVAPRKVRPHRHAGSTPRVLCVLDPAHVLPTASRIVDRVQANQRAGKGRSFVFIDPEMRVYVIHELQASAREWTADVGRLPFLVATYTSTRHAADGLTVTLDGVANDIREHVDDLRRTA